jgi:hypothetical protein
MSSIARSWALAESEDCHSLVRDLLLAFRIVVRQHADSGGKAQAGHPACIPGKTHGPEWMMLQLSSPRVHRSQVERAPEISCDAIEFDRRRPRPRSAFKQRLSTLNRCHGPSKPHAKKARDRNTIHLFENMQRHVERSVVVTSWQT